MGTVLMQRPLEYSGFRSGYHFTSEGCEDGESLGEFDGTRELGLDGKGAEETRGVMGH